MIVGVLRAELHLPDAASLKDKRSILKSLKDQLHRRFNVSAVELDPQEKWQRASVGVATVSSDSRTVESCLRAVIEWIEGHHGVVLLNVEQELF